MNIIWYMSDLFACGHIRGEVVARELNQRFTNHSMICKTDIMLSDYFWANVMVFQRANSQLLLQKMRMAKDFGIKTIYDIDDDVFNTPPGFQKPYDFYSRPDVQEAITQLMNTADAATCSTYELAKSLAPRIPLKPKFVLENALDAFMWDAIYHEKQTQKKDTVTLGWMASGSHVIDAPLVRDVLKTLMHDYPNLRIHCIGWIGFNELGLEEYKDRITVDGWVEISDLPRAMMDFDIGLAPVADNPFNRSKSNIKWLQYSALGIPTVASPLPPYKDIRHGKDGLLATENRPGSWEDCLRSLIESESYRKQMGADARLCLIQKWDMRNNIGQWLDVFDLVRKS